MHKLIGNKSISTVNAPVEIKELTFSALRAPYVATKPIHESQKILDLKEDGTLIIQLQLMPNPEIESVILSYGCDEEVFQPFALKERISEVVKKNDPVAIREKKIDSSSDC